MVLQALIMWTGNISWTGISGQPDSCTFLITNLLPDSLLLISLLNGSETFLWCSLSIGLSVGPLVGVLNNACRNNCHQRNDWWHDRLTSIIIVTLIFWSIYSFLLLWMTITCWKCNPHVRWSVGRSDGCSVFHNFPKGREVTFSCSYRRI